MDEYSLDELKEKMQSIVGRWHPDTARSGGDGDAGNLLEDLLGIPENNLFVADYGQYEIKTHKRESGALIKIFSLAPNPRPFSKDPFLEVVGWPDQRHPQTRKRFSFTSGVNGNGRGFKIIRDGDILSFVHELERVERDTLTLPYENDANYGEYSDRVRAHPNFINQLPKTWDIRSTNNNGNENCEHRIIEKLQNVLLVERTTRTNPNTNNKEHKYHECWLLSKFHIERFIEYIDNDILKVDFNMQTNHDHGVAFRINKNHLHELFEHSIKLL